MIRNGPCYQNLSQNRCIHIYHTKKCFSKKIKNIRFAHIFNFLWKTLLGVINVSILWGAAKLLNFATRCQNYPKLHGFEVAPFNFKIMKQSRRNSRILKKVTQNKLELETLCSCQKHIENPCVLVFYIKTV